MAAEKNALASGGYRAHGAPVHTAAQPQFAVSRRRAFAAGRHGAGACLAGAPAAGQGQLRLSCAHAGRGMDLHPFRARARRDRRQANRSRPRRLHGLRHALCSHLLRNPFEEECVYLMGGEDKPIDVVSYPQLDKRYLLMQTDKGAEFYEFGEARKAFGKAD